jgi:predicted SprT family Zn-dependent metalloprotease
MTMNASPTRTYTSLDAAYSHFNRTLFGGSLPHCLITMQRHKGAYGYFSGDRFASLDNPEDITDEIALNPAHFASRTPTKILSTLVHEMVHLWQHRDKNAKPGRRGYHNKEWAEKMREVGLIPIAVSDTGQPNGKDTGEKVSHTIEEGGRFDKACAAYLATKPAILYQDRAGEGETRKKKSASKTKYTCPDCQANAWAKPDTNLVCGDCDQPMEAEEPGEGGG